MKRADLLPSDKGIRKPLPSCVMESSCNTISVALCTFNGERFLATQLASILRQTRLPDEVVLCDDGSSDQTLQQVARFAAEASFPVRVICNSQNLGSTENFLQAIRACSGSLIALSDQDDEWHPCRLQRSEQELSANQAASLLFSNANLINDQGEEIGSDLWSRAGFSRSMQQRLMEGDYLPCVQFRFVTGATVVFRAHLRDLCFPVGEGWIHDEWLAAAAPLFADLHPVAEALISYRQHDSQQIGPTRRPSLLRKLGMSLQMFFQADVAQTEHWGHIMSAATRSEVLCRSFIDRPLGRAGTLRLGSYQGYVDFLNFRLSLSRNRLFRVIPIFQHRAAYKQHVGSGSLLKDLLLSYVPK